MAGGDHHVVASIGLWTKTSIEFYKDPDDAVFKGLEE